MSPIVFIRFGHVYMYGFIYETLMTDIHRIVCFTVLVLVPNKAEKYSKAYTFLIPYCNVFNDCTTQREKAIKITEELARRKDSLKELELKVPKIPEYLHFLTFSVMYFHYRTLTLLHFKLSRTSLVLYLQVCEMEGEHQQWTARHIAAVDAAQTQVLAKAESERNEFEQARTVLCCTVIECTTSYFLLY
jgi:hypothetical protein